MKILILTNYANGLVLFRKELLQSFLEKNIQVKVSVPFDENCKKIEELGCEVIPTPLERRGNNPLRDGKLFLFYRKLLKTERPDVVLTYTIKPNLYGGLACKMAKIPYLVNITGLGTALENGGMLSKILLTFYQISTKKAKRVFFQNSENMRFFHENNIALDNSYLLPGSGVNLETHAFHEYPSETEGITFLSVIRIMKDKGIEEFLVAAEKMKQAHDNIHFLLVGEYEEETRDFYAPWIKKLCDMGSIQYLGHIDNVPEIMAKSHVIIHPSYHEGLSNVLLEAAACGRPVLSSNVAGCRETYIEGISGLSFMPKDTESLMHAIETILTYTEADRREMGIRGREHVKAVFDRRIVIDTYIKEISHITEENVL